MLLLLSLHCVTIPPEDLNEAQVSRRLRNVSVSISPLGGVSSSASSEAGKESVAYLTTYLMVYMHIYWDQ